MLELNPAHGFHRHAAAAPGRAALVIEGRTWSYGELAEGARAVAGWLRETVGDEPARVGILCGRTFHTFAAILGTAWAGHTYVPLPQGAPPRRLAELVRRARLAALIASDEAGPAGLPPEVHAAAPAARLFGGGATAGRATGAPVAVEPSRAAYVIFTSGTTGEPKGVVVTAANLASFVDAVDGLYGLGPDDRMSQCPDLTWDLSVFDVHLAWRAGASLHVVPEAVRLAPGRFIREQRLTVWCSAPSVAGMMARLGQLRPAAFPSLRVTMFCGEPLTRAAALAWRQAAPASVVDNHYGPTEATCSCLFQRVDASPRVTDGRDIIAIGRPFPSMRAAIVDEQGRFAGGAATGELALSGPQVAAGYLDDPAATARRFRTLDAGEGGAASWYLTGDLARRDPDGVFHHVGRADHQVKIMGRRIELEEVEAHLRAASGCDEVAAVAWPHEDGLPMGLVGFVAGPVDAAAVREALSAMVPAYLVPRRIISVAALPATAAGKLDRRALLRLLDGGG
jgi:D-alanine--poly(phosphoribitol) ligase subunit 1